jgi:hypothetical protein
VIRLRKIQVATEAVPLPGQGRVTIYIDQDGVLRSIDELGVVRALEGVPGEPGEPGEPGAQGVPGEPGAQGAPGLNAFQLKAVINSSVNVSNVLTQLMQVNVPAGELIVGDVIDVTAFGRLNSNATAGNGNFTVRVNGVSVLTSSYGSTGAKTNAAIQLRGLIGIRSVGSSATAFVNVVESRHVAPTNAISQASSSFVFDSSQSLAVALEYSTSLAAHSVVFETGAIILRR